jgi:hypothetical protein
MTHIVAVDGPAVQVRDELVVGADRAPAASEADEPPEEIEWGPWDDPAFDLPPIVPWFVNGSIATPWEAARRYALRPIRQTRSGRRTTSSRRRAASRRSGAAGSKGRGDPDDPEPSPPAADDVEAGSRREARRGGERGCR